MVTLRVDVVEVVVAVVIRWRAPRLGAAAADAEERRMGQIRDESGSITYSLDEVGRDRVVAEHRDVVTRQAGEVNVRVVAGVVICDPGGVMVVDEETEPIEEIERAVDRRPAECGMVHRDVSMDRVGLDVAARIRDRRDDRGSLRGQAIAEPPEDCRCRALLDHNVAR